MPVQTIECHIATVLMKRFLDGEDLPNELLSDLEQHIKSCSNCQATVNDEKHSIEEVLDGPTESSSGIAALAGKFGLKTATATGFATAYPTDALIASARMTSTTTPGGIAAFKNPKVLFLSCGLAITLIAMSTILRDPTMIFGKKATLPATIVSSENKEADPEAHSVSTGDEHSDHTEESPAATAVHDLGEKIEESPKDEHSAPEENESHSASASAAKADHAEQLIEKPTNYRGGHIPGEKTVEPNNVVLIGSEGIKDQSPTKESKPVSKPKQTPTQKKTSVRKSSSTAKKSPPPTKKSTSGIKIYDTNGKPIH